VLYRYRLSDRRAAEFVTGGAEYDISADGHKLLYRSAGGGAGGRGRGGAAPEGAPGPSLFIVDADRNPPQPGTGRLAATLRMYLDPKEEFKQIFNEGWRNERDYLYVPNMHGADWPKMKEMYAVHVPVPQARTARRQATWGGLVHTADTPGFIDDGSMIAPRGGFFTRDGKWAVENEGVAPDIDVENWPKDVIAGHDPQLERAVQEAMRLLKEHPVDRRITEPPPPTWGKRKGGQ